MREIDIEEDIFESREECYLDEDELVENDDLDAFLVAFNKGTRLT